VALDDKRVEDKACDNTAMRSEPAIQSKPCHPKQTMSSKANHVIQSKPCHPEQTMSSRANHVIQSKPCHPERSEGSPASAYKPCHPNRSDAKRACHPERSEGSHTLATTNYEIFMNKTTCIIAHFLI